MVKISEERMLNIISIKRFIPYLGLLTHSRTFNFSQPSSVRTQTSPELRQSFEMKGITRFSQYDFTKNKIGNIRK